MHYGIFVDDSIDPVLEASNLFTLANAWMSDFSPTGSIRGARLVKLRGTRWVEASHAEYEQFRVESKAASTYFTVRRVAKVRATNPDAPAQAGRADFAALAFELGADELVGIGMAERELFARMFKKYRAA